MCPRGCVPDKVKSAVRRLTKLLQNPLADGGRKRKQEKITSLFRKKLAVQRAPSVVVAITREEEEEEEEEPL